MKSITVARWFLALIGGFIATAQVFAQNPSDPTFPIFSVTGNTPASIEVGSKMGVLVDNDKSLSRQQALQPGQAWQTITRKSPNFGFTDQPHWFRFQIENQDGQDVQRFIELPIPFIDDVQLYHYAGGVLKTSYALGDEKPFEQRPVKHQNFVMPVNLSPGTNQIYVRLASSGSVEAPLRIWDPVRFHEASDTEKLLQGGVAGILLVMIVYNLFVFFSTRDINYVYYIAFVASYMLFHFTLTGYTFAYLWPHAIRWNSFAISTFIASSAVFTCLFANSFLKLKQFSRPAHYGVSTMTLGSAVLLIATFFLPYNLTVRIGAAIVMPVAITALVLGYWRWWRGAKFARFYCLAWTAVLVGISILSANKFGMVPANVWTENASQIGIVMLVVLLSITLADRINSDRSLRIGAQATALAHERRARASQEALIRGKEDANRKLEQRVKARTTELNNTLDQLKVANDMLQLLSRTDGLTQIGNRAFFDSALNEEHRRALRSQNPLSLILFDVDHFKEINDTHGHLGGDACLRALANLIRPRISRAGDVFARYGGEEFVVLLANSKLENSSALAETLRTEIENFQVEFEGKSIRFTVSFGVAGGVPDARTSPQEFLAAADRMLYQAKRDGRNCVKSTSVALSTAPQTVV
ncbi:diguanylate cyclase [Rhodoferax sp.]|uniref:sensor domain-containing diguanylate cyclase n=1 Tax=Rhodoferax sp. TaxID=50421 RepID=UPI001ECDC0BC|nr:diguanylate cyclase [Rhodoferax sp.]MBT9508300.1 diguanylate cyclase [Rhodoferax sp.]